MINARDIAKIENKRKEIKKEIYTKIYEQFSRKIRQTVELGQKQVFVQVPSFLLGYPTFDRDKALEYLKRQLERAGFVATQTGSYEILVTWNTKKTTEEKQEEEPEFDEFPTLMNLKKAASKYRRA
jgi:DNA-binding transcriptional regulator YhcF (GntR family)